jgi:hypothetical protein
VLYDLRVVAQTLRESYRGALGQDVWGERVFASELRYDVDEGEGEGMEVLLGWARSQVHSELVLQHPKVEVERLVAPKGSGLRGI